MSFWLLLCVLRLIEFMPSLRSDNLYICNSEFLCYESAMGLIGVGHF